MNKILRNALAVAGLAIATSASAQVTFYENANFSGRALTVQRQASNLSNTRINNRASSVVVHSNRWEVCEDSGYRGRCVILRKGSYPSLADMSMNNRVSSVRRVGSKAQYEDDRYAPQPSASYDYRRRSDERLYEARVTSAHAVMGQDGQRCWVERERVSGERSGANVPGALAGALIGGVIGHQIGSGRGNDVATVGGVAVGAAVGANVGRDGSYTQDVRRCEQVAGDVDYWDVTYNYRGKQHRVQMTDRPGDTVSVNRQGEPRG